MPQALSGIDVRPLDEPLGRATGELLAISDLSDVVDAAVGLLSVDGDEIVTLDRDDFAQLVATLAVHVELVRP